MHSLKVFYRPDNYPYWISWKEFGPQDLQQVGKPSALGAGGIPTAVPGFIPRLSFGKPQNQTDPITKRSLRRGYEFQVKFVGTGHVVLNRFRLHAQKQTERSRAVNKP